MRVNAKETELLKGLKKKDSLEDLESNRKQFIGRSFQPLTELVSSSPSFVMAYVGGMLAQSGGLNAVDIVGFQSALTNLITNANHLYKEVTDLLQLEDRRFEYCFSLIVSALNAPHEFMLKDVAAV